MFKRIKETKRILTYREPAGGHVSDIVFVDRPHWQPSPVAKRLANLIEGGILVALTALVTAKLAPSLFGIFHPKSASLVTIVAILGTFLGYVVHKLADQFQALLREKLNISDKLAPFLGRKIESTINILRG